LPLVAYLFEVDIELFHQLSVRNIEEGSLLFSQLTRLLLFCSQILESSGTVKSKLPFTTSVDVSLNLNEFLRVFIVLEFLDFLCTHVNQSSVSESFFANFVEDLGIREFGKDILSDLKHTQLHLCVLIGRGIFILLALSHLLLLQPRFLINLHLAKRVCDPAGHGLYLLDIQLIELPVKLNKQG